MARTLILARHAKSDWHAGAATDHERPLNGRGLREAPLLADALNAAEHRPTLILSSDARRTEETALLMESSFGAPAVRFLPSLYLGSLSDIQQAVETHEDDHQTIMVLGHNPGFSHAAAMLSRSGVELKTACAAVLVTELDNLSDAIMAPR